MHHVMMGIHPEKCVFGVNITCKSRWVATIHIDYMAYQLYMWSFVDQMLLCGT